MSRPINDDAFRAVAHPLRRKVLELVRKQPRSAGELARSCKTTNASMSMHLRVLRENRLVSEKRDGQKRIYSLNEKGLGPVKKWLGQF